MSPIAPRRTLRPRKSSRKNLPERTENRTPTTATVTQSKRGKKTQPTPSRSNHGKAASIQIAEIVAVVSNRTGKQLQSHVGLSPKKKTQIYSPSASTSSSSIKFQPTQLESDCSQDVRNPDKSDKDSITVSHGDHCPNCQALKSINEISLKALLHHLKGCATYCVFYQLMEDIEKQIMSNKSMNKKYKKLSPIFHSKQAHHLCELSAENPQEFPSIKSKSSKRAPQLFKKAAKLSEELLGPVDTIAFDCKRYEEYLRLLLEIAQMIGADAQLIGDIRMYLKPFDRNRIATSSNPYNKWDETFFDLKHSPEDKNFGSNLKEIAEMESGKESFFKLTGYTKNCH